MINYLQGFCGPGNFLWFLLRRVLQGPGPKVMLSELLLFPIIVPNLSFSGYFTPPSPTPTLSQTFLHLILPMMGQKAQFAAHTHFIKGKRFLACWTLLSFNLNTAGANFSYFFLTWLGCGKNMILSAWTDEKLYIYYSNCEIIDTHLHWHACADLKRF